MSGRVILAVTAAQAQLLRAIAAGKDLEGRRYRGNPTTDALLARGYIRERNISAYAPRHYGLTPRGEHLFAALPDE